MADNTESNFSEPPEPQLAPTRTPSSCLNAEKDTAVAATDPSFHPPVSATAFLPSSSSEVAAAARWTARRKVLPRMPEVDVINLPGKAAAASTGCPDICSERELMGSDPSRASPTPSGPGVESDTSVYYVSAPAYRDLDHEHHGVKYSKELLTTRRPLAKLKPLPWSNVSVQKHLSASRDVLVMQNTGEKAWESESQKMPVQVDDDGSQQLPRGEQQRVWRVLKLKNARPLPLFQVFPPATPMPKPETAALPGSVPS